MRKNKGRKDYNKNMTAVDKQRVGEHREWVLLKYEMIRSTPRGTWKTL